MYRWCSSGQSSTETIPRIFTLERAITSTPFLSYPLETVNLNPVYHEGVSESTVEDVSLTELHEGKYVILVHQSPEELTTYLVCGEIGGGTVGTTKRVAPGDPPNDPSYVRIGCRLQRWE